MSEEKKILILAGPNGAGKTTFAREFLPHEAGCPEFINADLIAEGLSPFRPATVAFSAGRIMLDRMRELEAAGRSFAVETNLASLGYLPRFAEWRLSGFRLKLYFLKLPDPEFAIRRVAHRVRMGGHDVPEPTIRRRFARGWENFQNHYRLEVHEWAVYDAAQSPPVLLETGKNQFGQ